MEAAAEMATEKPAGCQPDASTGMAPARSRMVRKGDKLTRDRGNAQARKRYGRTKVSNGRAILAGIDSRLLWVRRLRDVLAAHLSDLPDASVAERSIIRRASVLEVELEQLEAKFAVAGEASAEQLDIYARVAGNLRRLLESVGLRRRAKLVEVPTPEEYSRQLQLEDDAELVKAAEAEDITIEG